MSIIFNHQQQSKKEEQKTCKINLEKTSKSLNKKKYKNTSIGNSRHDLFLFIYFFLLIEITTKKYNLS